jgi:hypothetical protein
MKIRQREDYALRRIEYNKIDLETYVNRKHKLNNEAAIIQAILEDKKETQRAILEKLNKLGGLEYKIAYTGAYDSIKECIDHSSYKRDKGKIKQIK